MVSDAYSESSIAEGERRWTRYISRARSNDEANSIKSISIIISSSTMTAGMSSSGNGSMTRDVRSSEDHTEPPAAS